MPPDNSFQDAGVRLVEATIRLLATKGPSEVKARSLSKEAGLSTMGVYTYFGGVPELLQAVADEGFKRLATVFDQVSVTDDPMSDLCNLAMACRDFARRNPHLYDLMFGLSIHGRYGPSRGDPLPASDHSPAFKTAFSHLVKRCGRLVHDKCLPDVDPAFIGMQLWSAVHGFITLELAGHFVDVANPPSDILVPMTNNVIIGMGASRKKVESSTAGVAAAWSAGPQAQPSAKRSRQAKTERSK